MPGTDEQIKADILAWRAASPAVEWLWGGQTARKARDILANARRPGYVGTVAERWSEIPKERDAAFLFGVEGAAVAAMQSPGWKSVVRLDGTPSGIAFMNRDRILFCRLPSGRVLTYHRPSLFESDRGGWGITFEGWNTNPKNGPVGWITMSTWGGRLVENINQATCRDILAPACIALEEHGYPVVLHVYDEIVAEVPEGFGDVEEFESIVTVRPEWAHDWPIRAPGGYRAKRYRKG
jgi:DNA polymerase